MQSQENKITDQYPFLLAFQVAQWVKNLPEMQETQVQSPGQEDPLEEEMATHSNNLPGEFHGQRSLAGYNPWDWKESDTTEQLTLTFTYH